MKPTQIDILSAMTAQRPEDRIIAYLEKGVCIALSAYDNGTFSPPSIFKLDNGTVYGFGRVSDIERLNEYVQSQPNTYPGHIQYYDNGKGAPTFRRKTFDKRRWKKVHRQVIDQVRYYLKNANAA